MPVCASHWASPPRACGKLLPTRGTWEGMELLLALGGFRLIRTHVCTAQNVRRGLLVGIAAQLASSQPFSFITRCTKPELKHKQLASGGFVVMHQHGTPGSGCPRSLPKSKSCGVPCNHDRWLAVYIHRQPEVIKPVVDGLDTAHVVPVASTVYVTRHWSGPAQPMSSEGERSKVRYP